MAAEPRPGRDSLLGYRASVVLVAAGQSTRMGELDKTFAYVLGIPLIAHTLSHFQSCSLIYEIVLVLSQDNLELGKEIVHEHNFSKVSRVCAGGKRRQDSVSNGLEALQPCQWVMVHDGARPCLDQSLLERGMAAAQETGAAVAGIPVKDTIKIVSPEQVVTATPPRETLWAAQTPQIFRYDLLRKAHQLCAETMTDDAAMVESLGHPVKMFLGSYANLKVTTPEDLILVEAILRNKSAANA
ncbi:MAG: 2-C-methyl-D-erythritol 4-phosphate cytidylyltransferase [Chloroflexi bacterium]|nr:2-C-methyl-D-erythritol 4-phosphate cytidylyltransferase [Chloroflexota bacterium]MDA1220015.1 2-C-methyl-D-erythritol 4-phosphate cytidylyltransferase [Chloroflexota bacterium]PKB57042.1 MAG: 2-C-methyl-D-erythritol 4-phosphate cytidylyltransferase [SAR202 cluster bacterium Casp-Chloro-G3]